MLIVHEVNHFFSIFLVVIDSPAGLMSEKKHAARSQPVIYGGEF